MHSVCSFTRTETYLCHWCTWGGLQPNALFINEITDFIYILQSNKIFLCSSCAFMLVRQISKFACVFSLQQLWWSTGSVLAFQTRPKPSDFLGRKNPQHAFLQRGSKAVVPCRRCAGCKRSLNCVEVVILAKLPDNISRPQFHFSLLGSLASLWTWRHLATKVGTSKGGGK